MKDEIKGGESASLECPRCNATEKRVRKGGRRRAKRGLIQRHSCRDCGYRFSGAIIFSDSSDIEGERQVCVTVKGAKNLAVAEKGKSVAGDVSEKERTSEYVHWLRKEGKRPSTIEGYARTIRSLLNNRVDLLNPESVKEYLASLPDDVTEGRKRNIVHAYKQYHVMMFGKKWNDAPKYRRVRKPQYLPERDVLIQIIAGVPNKYRPFCQMLMETGMRSAELWALKWEDIDSNRKMVSVTPAKNGDWRELPISDKAIKMLKSIPRESEYVFKKDQLKNFREGFRRYRVKLAYESGEEEIVKCTFKTFRTYYANNASYKYKDSFEVQYRMGHRSMKTTMLYINRAKCRHVEYVRKICRTTEDECEAIGAGFEYVKDTIEGHSLWKKAV